ncbi:MAG: serpin family protein [Muribaculaceae bacterium]|nr:serpin family protein [Muribaculaceae bacterium]
MKHIKSFIILTLSLFIYSCSDREPEKHQTVFDTEYEINPIINEYNDWCISAFKALCADAKGENVMFSPYTFFSNLKVLSEISDEKTRRSIMQSFGSDFDDDKWDNLCRIQRCSETNDAASVWLDEDFANANTGNDYLGSASVEIFNVDMSRDTDRSRVRWWISKIVDLEVIPSVKAVPETDILFLSVYRDVMDAYNGVQSVGSTSFTSATGNGKMVDMNVTEWTINLYQAGQSYYILCCGGRNPNYGSHLRSDIFYYMPKGNGSVDDIINDFRIPSSMYVRYDEKGTPMRGSFYFDLVTMAFPDFSFVAEQNLSEVMSKIGLDNLNVASSRTDAAVTINTQLNSISLASGKMDVSSQMLSGIGMEGEACAPRVSVSAKATEPLPEGVIAIDRPFIFVVRQECTGAILFMGKIEHLD